MRFQAAGFHFKRLTIPLEHLTQVNGLTRHRFSN